MVAAGLETQVKPVLAAADRTFRLGSIQLLDTRQYFGVIVHLLSQDILYVIEEPVIIIRRKSSLI
jgi:hypothetical protein